MSNTSISQTLENSKNVRHLDDAGQVSASRWASVYENHWRSLLAVIVLAGLAFAYAMRFVQDDAFISFRYAEHLAHGQKLTWNVGDAPVEGFTNLFFVLILAAVIRLGGDPVVASTAIGLVCFVFTLLVTFVLASGVVRSRAHALLCVLLVATNASFAAYATGGLETPLVTLLVTLAVFCAYATRPCTTARAASFGCASVLAIWTRLDSAVLLAPFAVLMVYEQVSMRRWRQLQVLLISGLGGAALLIGFKIYMFGSVLPITYFVKGSDVNAVMFLRGLEYVLAFCTHYGLFLPVALALLGFWRSSFAEGQRARFFTMIAAIILWCLYVCKVGGDFMEFRFLIPCFPLMILIVVWGIGKLQVRMLPLLAGGTLVLSSFIYLYNTYDEPILQEGTNIETIYGLEKHLAPTGDNWVGIGHFLGEHFHDSDVTISVGAAGAIPYYSRLRTIDVFGLSDPWIARNGVHNGSRAGHSRVAPLSYLQRSGVTLALWWSPLPGEKAPDDAVWVDLPIGTGRTVPALYLTKNAAVDTYIAREGWQVHRATP